MKKIIGRKYNLIYSLSKTAERLMALMRDQNFKTPLAARFSTLTVLPAMSSEKRVTIGVTKWNQSFNGLLGSWLPAESASGQ